MYGFLSLFHISVGQVFHEILEDDRVNVVAQHVDEKPVSDGSLSNNCVQVIQLSQSESHVEYIDSDRRTSYDDQMEKDHDSSDASKEEEPEPNEDVDLLIDDV